MSAMSVRAVSWLAYGCVLSIGALPVSSATARPGPQARTSASSALAADRIVHVQVLLDRAGFSPGEIDGVLGANTSRALAVLGRAKGLERAVTNAEAIPMLGGDATPAVTTYRITESDVAGPFTPEIPLELAAQAALPALGYRDALEALGERFHVSPALLRRLNPERRFVAGEEVQVPNVADRPAVTPPAGSTVRLEVSKSRMTLLVLAGDTVIFSAPVTSGSEHDPLPIGEWKVTGVSRNPPFHYNPALFWDAANGDEKSRIAPGPNNPVGLVWIDIDKPHYGLHGTPTPEAVGHTASHGCVRLTNWDAMTVAGLVRPGTPLVFTR
jgi:lipoprotein-anchoring transpeptidase ErfK/SrfK